MAKFARVTFGESDPAQFEEGIANLNQTVIPQARELPGFEGGYWLADRGTGKLLAVVVYDSEEHIRQTDEAAAQLRQQVGSVTGVTFTGVETYEVIGQA
jgi:heme-degrading monooxygenase HmoA